MQSCWKIYVLLVLGTCLLIDVDAFWRRSRERHHSNRYLRHVRKFIRPKPVRRIAELKIDQDDFRALCESKMTPEGPRRRTMETTFGSKGSSYLEGQGIDRKLLCRSELYKTIKRGDTLTKSENDATAMIVNEHNVDKLFDESHKKASLDKPKEFQVDVGSSVKMRHEGNNVPSGQTSSVVEGSAHNLSGVGFKRKSRGYTRIEGKRHRQLMKMDKFKESDFEIGV